MHHRYDILNAGEMIRQKDLNLNPASHPYSHQQLVPSLSVFEVQRGNLRKEGREGLVLQVKKEQSASGGAALGGLPAPASSPTQESDYADHQVEREQQGVKIKAAVNV